MSLPPSLPQENALVVVVSEPPPLQCKLLVILNTYYPLVNKGVLFQPNDTSCFMSLASWDTPKVLGMNVFMASSSVKKVAGTCSKYDLFMTSIAIVLVTTSTCEMFHMPKCRKF